MQRLAQRVWRVLWRIVRIVGVGLLAVCSVGVTLIVICTFIAQPHQINGRSMMPNFEDKELLLAEKVSYHFREPRRGEVVCFYHPKAHDFTYIKRVVGLPGEALLIENGQVIIFNDMHPDGFVLDEPYLAPGTKTYGRTTIETGLKFQIPEGQYVVMGDNRERSSDSREWGTVRRDELVGPASIYWPSKTLAAHP